MRNVARRKIWRPPKLARAGVARPLCRVPGRRSFEFRTVTVVSKFERLGSFRDLKLPVASKVEPFRPYQIQDWFEIRTVGIVSDLEPSSLRNPNRCRAVAGGCHE
ncbi:hypothetical protein ASD64_02590 [Mesorhizobium sp. Root157]|nr:hypothetical protein ASD64_02590 [Mesorhizobium sp. Root157]